MAKAAKQTPVIYEVSLTVDRAVIAEFDTWLDEHIIQMLAIEGFIDASIARPDSLDKSRAARVCSYQVSSQEALDKYFAVDAERMRTDGLERFGGRFDASRRVYSLADLPPNRKCLNCDAVLAARFCQVCGQKNGPRVISLREIAGDLIDDFLDLDSRFWRSIRPLIFKPGFLTTEFVRGRRMFYTPPFRMYLIASIAFFLVVTFDPAIELTANGDGEPATDVAALDTTDDTLQRLAEARESIDPDAPGAEIQAAAIDAAERALQQEAGADVEGEGATDDSEPGIEINDGKCSLTGAIDVPGLSEARSREIALALCHKLADDDGKAFGRALLNNLPTMMFIFLPALALVLKVLYMFSKRFYVEHLVFALHFHAFFFVVLAGTVLTHSLPGFVPLNGWIAGLTTAAVSIYIPIYLFRAMRRMYGQGFFLTLIKYLMLGVAYLASLLITVIIGSLVTLLAI